MSQPQAYAPEQGYKYQILVKCPSERSYEHCDYAVNKEDKEHLLTEYRMAYGAGFQLKTILLPEKYWSK